MIQSGKAGRYLLLCPKLFFLTLVMSAVLLCVWPVLAAALVHSAAREYPLYHLSPEPTASIKPIKVMGAAGDHLLLLFEVSKVRTGFLKVFIKENLGSSLSLKAYLVPPLPGVSGFPNLYDALLPLEQAALGNQDCYRVAVVIKIPNGYPAGLQNRDLVFQDGLGSIHQPLDLQVWRFSLPEDLPVTVLGNLWPEKKWFRRYHVDGDEAFVNALTAYLKFLRSYKINAIGNFYPVPIRELARGRSLSDFPQYLHLLEQALALGYRYFRLPALVQANRIDMPPNFFASYAKGYYSRMSEFCRSQNLLGKALVKVWDEPQPDDYPRVARAYGLVKEAAPQLITESAGRIPDPSLAALVNIWAVYNVYFDPEKVVSAQQAGQKIWLYANLLHGVDKPAVCQRLVGWYLFSSGCSGYLLWSVNYWPHDPWTTPPAGGTAGDFFRRGTLVYPQPSTGLPLPTLRLEAIRRGWEDYQYLVLLKEAAQQGKVDPVVYAQIQEKVASIAGNLKDNNPKVSWQQLEDVRLQIGELLDRATGDQHG